MNNEQEICVSFESLKNMTIGDIVNLENELNINIIERRLDYNVRKRNFKY